MWVKELLEIIKELVRDILTTLKDSVKQRDIFYFVALIIFIISFTIGMMFAIALIVIFITLLTSITRNLISNTVNLLSMIVIAITGFIGLKKGGSKNENQNLEKGRKA